MLYIESTKAWLKNSDHPLANTLRPYLKGMRTFNVPLPLMPYRVMASVFFLLSNGIKEVARIFWWTPLFKALIDKAPRHLYLYTGMPFIAGRLAITLGENCRISGQTTFSGRTQNSGCAQLLIGNNVGISWQSTIAVGKKVIIGNNVRIAGRCFLAGYPGHPINPVARANGEAELENQIGDIVLEDNVWLGTGCTVLPKVRIGANSIIGTGSVVTKDIPANVIAAGNPAKVIRPLSEQELGLTLNSAKFPNDIRKELSHVA